MAGKLAGKIESSRAFRVVALLAAGSAVRRRLGASAFEAGGSIKIVAWPNGYEAAAELLGGRASALLVDLSLLAAEHARLLEVARDLGVPVVAFGTISTRLDGTALATARLVSLEQVCNALRELASELCPGNPGENIQAAEEGPGRLEATSTPASHRDRSRRPPDQAGPDSEARSGRELGEYITQEQLDAILRHGL